jgi:hypothetical protein
MCTRALTRSTGGRTSALAKSGTSSWASLRRSPRSRTWGTSSTVAGSRGKSRCSGVGEWRICAWVQRGFTDLITWVSTWVTAVGWHLSLVSSLPLQQLGGKSKISLPRVPRGSSLSLAEHFGASASGLDADPPECWNRGTGKLGKTPVTRI